MNMKDFRTKVFQIKSVKAWLNGYENEIHTLTRKEIQKATKHWTTNSNFGFVFKVSIQRLAFFEEDRKKSRLETRLNFIRQNCIGTNKIRNSWRKQNIEPNIDATHSLFYLNKFSYTKLTTEEKSKMAIHRVSDRFFSFSILQEMILVLFSVFLIESIGFCYFYIISSFLFLHWITQHVNVHNWLYRCWTVKQKGPNKVKRLICLLKNCSHAKILVFFN